jgi:ATP-binding cassette, subfamily B, bacterial
MPPRSIEQQPLFRLLQYSKTYRPQIWSAIAFTMLNQLCDLAPPYLIGLAVDSLVERDRSLIARLGITDAIGQLAILSVLTLVVWGLESLFQYLYDRLWRNLAQAIQHELRIDAYSHVQTLEMEYFEDQSTGTLLSILNDDVNQLEEFLNSGARDILQVSTIVLAVGITFLFMAPQVAWYAMLPIPAIVWGSFTFQNRLTTAYTSVREAAADISDRLANNLSGIATIKSFTTEGYERDRVIQESDTYQRYNRKAIAYSTAFVPLIRLIIVIGFVTVLFLGGVEVSRDRLSVGTYSFMVFIVQQLLWPFADLAEVLDQYQRAMASVKRVMGLLDTPVMIETGDRALPLSTVRGEVQMQQVSFAYADRQPILQQLSLHIPAGANIGIAGATGSGKSTLVKLLLRFYEPQAGEILVDGLDIRSLSLHDLRRCIGWVSQDVFLFHGTVAENIAYGEFEASHDRIMQAAKLAEAHEFIEQLPQGYDTIVGERGQKLSGGQRQRLAIARALLKDPPILILDEATSAVDNETEAAIQRSLTRITQNRTTIAIAHRLSTIRHSDRIYVMENGQIVEQGTHDELLALSSIYAGLWSVQSGIQDG